jgi:hypothetical protein
MLAPKERRNEKDVLSCSILHFHLNSNFNIFRHEELFHIIPLMLIKLVEVSSSLCDRHLFVSS